MGRDTKIWVSLSLNIISVNPTSVTNDLIEMFEMM